MFQPVLSLLPRDPARYAMRCVVLTPSNAFSAGLIRRGAPPRQPVPMGAAAFVLELLEREGRSQALPSTVRAGLDDIELGQGVERVVLFVSLRQAGPGHGSLVGQASIGISEAQCTMGDRRTGRERELQSADWRAYAHYSPNGPFTLAVRGEVELEHPGYLVVLKPAARQALDPRVLLLELELIPQRGEWPPVPSWLEASYRDPDYPGLHEEVVVSCQGRVLARFPIESAL